MVDELPVAVQRTVLCPYAVPAANSHTLPSHLQDQTRRPDVTAVPIKMTVAVVLGGPCAGYFVNTSLSHLGRGTVSQGIFSIRLACRHYLGCFLIDDWRGRAQPTVGSATLGRWS